VDDVETRHLFRLVRRWWWLFILVPLLAGITAFIIGGQLNEDAEPRYTARATLLINVPPGSEDQRFSRETYQQFATTTSVLASVIESLGLPYDVETLRKDVSVSPTADQAQLLDVAVVNADPARAADIANAIAEQLGVYAGQQAAQASNAPLAEAARQIEVTRGQLDEIDRQIQTLEQSQNANDPAVVAQLAPLRDQRTFLQSSYEDLISRQTDLQLSAAEAQSQITVSELATEPTTADSGSSGRIVPVILGILFGLLLAGVLSLLLGYVDTSIRSAADIAQLGGGPLIGAIPTIRRLGAGPEQLFVKRQSDSQATEAIRKVRTGLRFASTSTELDSIAIVGPSSGEGRSVIAANLAESMAQTGISVAIIDADLREPAQHAIFGIGNEQGLSTLLSQQRQSWESATVGFSSHALYVLPAGPPPPNPGDLLATPRMRTLIAEIRQAVDFVIVDTPAMLDTGDALMVASCVDGVILVSQVGKTRVDELRESLDALRQGSVRVVGVVINRERRRGMTRLNRKEHEQKRSEHSGEREIPTTVRDHVSNRSASASD
jgi:capsular exopolysaccharide synthesis family protein